MGICDGDSISKTPPHYRKQLIQAPVFGGDKGGIGCSVTGVAVKVARPGGGAASIGK